MVVHLVVAFELPFSSSNESLGCSWCRWCTANQSSVAKAWKEFDDDGRMKDSSFRDRGTQLSLFNIIMWVDMLMRMYPSLSTTCHSSLSHCIETNVKHETN